MKHFFTLTLALLITSLPLTKVSQASPHPQQDAKDYQFQTMFIYNFTKYMEWSDGKGRDFVIAVLGNSPIKNELMKIAATRKVGDKRIIVRQFDTPSDVKDSHILYVSEQFKGQLSSIIATANQQNTLVVSSGDGLAKAGSHISFVKKGTSVRFEMNKETTRQAGIKVSSMLDRLAILVN